MVRRKRRRRLSYLFMPVRTYVCVLRVPSVLRCVPPESDKHPCRTWRIHRRRFVKSLVGRGGVGIGDGSATTLFASVLCVPRLVIVPARHSRQHRLSTLRACVVSVVDADRSDSDTSASRRRRRARSKSSKRRTFCISVCPQCDGGGVGSGCGAITPLLSSRSTTRKCARMTCCLLYTSPSPRDRG